LQNTSAVAFWKGSSRPHLGQCSITPAPHLGQNAGAEWSVAPSLWSSRNTLQSKFVQTALYIDIAFCLQSLLERITHAERACSWSNYNPLRRRLAMLSRQCSQAYLPASQILFDSMKLSEISYLRILRIPRPIRLWVRTSLANHSDQFTHEVGLFQSRRYAALIRRQDYFHFFQAFWWQFLRDSQMAKEHVVIKHVYGSRPTGLVVRSHTPDSTTGWGQSQQNRIRVVR